MAGKYFNQRIGHIEPGAPADIVVLDYRPPTPMNNGNYPWHFVFGVDSSFVRYTIVGGRVVVEEGQIISVDEIGIRARASELAAALWERLDG